VLIGLDLDGVLCDIGLCVAARIADRFGVSTHPATWRAYDLRQLQLGLPELAFHAFLEEVFDDPDLYRCAPAAAGAVEGVSRLRQAGWTAVGITARPAHLGDVTLAWLKATGMRLDSVHHTPVGTKSAVARRLGVVASIEDNPAEAELLGEVCQSWLLDRPYNRSESLQLSCRLSSWDDAVGRLCQLRLFA